MCFSNRVVFLIAFLSLSFGSQAQAPDRYLRFKMTDVSMDMALDSLSEISDYNFSYNASIFPERDLFSFDFSERTISQILSDMLAGLDVDFEITGDQIILKKRRLSRRIVDKQYFKISGFVKESDSKDPIPGVNVYLDGTTLGAITDANGGFIINRVPIGSFRIIFSHLSYDNRVYDFSKSTTSEFFINSELQLSTSLLNQIEITADIDRKEKKSRARLIADFEEQFIGTSAFSDECTLINPDVVKFDYNKNFGALYASANEPIIIQNNALGYNLYCQLDNFFSTEYSVRFIGKVRFEELTPSNNRQERNWEQHRSRSYYGSIQHFFKSLVDGNHEEEGFRIYFLDNLEDLSNPENNSQKIESILTPSGVPFRWQLNLSEIVYVVFLKELESTEYLREMEKDFRNDISNPNKLIFVQRSPQNQRSMIELTEGPVFVDLNGHVLNPEGLSISGYWSWERMADLVPKNYVPDE